MAGALHHRPAGRGLPAHEQRDPDQAFIAHDRDFRRRTAFHDVEERHDAIGGEIHVVQFGAGLVDRHAKRQRHVLQVRDQALVIRRGQRGKQMILSGGSGCGETRAHGLLRQDRSESKVLPFSRLFILRFYVRYRTERALHGCR